MKNTLNAEKLERMHALIVRRLQAAGREGIHANDFSAMLKAELGSTEAVNRHRLVDAVNSGKIFRKLVSNDGGGRVGLYFLTAQLRDEHVSMNSEEATYVPKPDAVPIPKFGIVEHRDIEGIELGKGVTLKPGVKVQVCTAYLGDYRIKVDPLSCPRLVDSNQCREWAKA